MIILMFYVMIVYCGIGPVHDILKSNTPVYFSIGITGLIVVANFGVMIKMTATKLKQKLQEKKYKNLQKAA